MNNNKKNKLNLTQFEIMSPRGIKGDVRLFITRFPSNGYDNLPRIMSGAGSSVDSTNGFFLSEMEAYERFANCLNCNKIVYSDAYSLGSNAADMNEFPKVSHALEQNSLIRDFDTHKILRWIKSYELQSSERKYIPLEYINLYTDPKFNGEGTTSPISTGMSVHDSYTEAILNGIYEVVERDAIALTWLLKNPGYRIENSPYGLDFDIFDNKFLGSTELFEVSTVDGIYTFCLKANAHHNTDISTVLMFATHVDPEIALRKLRKELTAVIYSMTDSLKRFPNIIEQDYTKFYTVEQSGLYMAHIKNREHFSFFEYAKSKQFSVMKKFNFKNSNEELEYVKRVLKGRKIYVTDLTNRECIDRGIKAVKVNIPSLQPISFIHNSRYLGHYRIEEYAMKHSDYFNRDDINEYPLAFS
ncbi:YcaO-like family protein [Streptococcus suis]